MKRSLSLFFLLGFAIVNHLYGQQILAKKDLQSEWKVFENDGFIPYNSKQHVSTIYFSINPSFYRGDFLEIRSDLSVDIFLSGKLILTNVRHVQLSIDSLSNNASLAFAIRNVGEIESLTTRIITKVDYKESSSSQEITNRPEMHYRDFVTVAFILLIIFFIFLIRLNPGLTMDYFSITKVFSIRESDDQSYSRIISTSILYYVFVSLILGLFFTILSNEIPHQFLLAQRIQLLNFLMIFFGWLKVSLVIVGLIFIKWFLIYSLAYLFGFREEATLHFFNFIRLLLILSVLITIVAGFYFAIRGTEETIYIFLFKAIRFVLFSWIIILFFKMGSKLRSTKFHLFSYLCATEILPLLIIAKVLYE